MKMVILILFTLSFYIFANDYEDFEDKPNYLIKCKPEYLDKEYGVCTDPGPVEYYDEDELAEVVEKMLEEKTNEYHLENLAKQERETGKDVERVPAYQEKNSINDAVITRDPPGYN